MLVEAAVYSSGLECSRAAIVDTPLSMVTLMVLLRDMWCGIRALNLIHYTVDTSTLIVVKSAVVEVI